MIARGVTRALSLFASTEDPHGSPIGTYLATHRGEVVGELGAWRQSAACKPFVGSSNEISRWVRSSLGSEQSGDSWTTLGGPIITKTLQSLSAVDDVKCRSGIFKAFITIFMTSNASGVGEEYATLRIRKMNISESVPHLCETYRAEFRAIFQKFFENEDWQRSFREGPFAKFIWTLCPNELLLPTIALVGIVPLSVALGSIILSGLGKALERRATLHEIMSLLFDVWKCLHFRELIDQITEDKDDPEPYEVEAMMYLVRMVGTVVLRSAQFPGASEICRFGSQILREVFDENAGFASLTRVCPSVFRDGYCGLRGVGHENWLRNEMIPHMKWDVLIDVAVKSQTLSNRKCSSDIKFAVTSAFASEMIQRNVPLARSREEAVKVFSSRYIELCPLITLQKRYRSPVWYLFHLCHYNEKLVCPIAKFSPTSAEEIYAGLVVDFGIKSKEVIKEFIDATNFIHVVNAISCREALLQVFDRILQGIAPVDIIELRSSFEAALGSEIQSMCGHVPRELGYVNIFCDEKRIQDIEKNPLVWTALWRKYGFENEGLCSFSQRFDLSDEMLRLPADSTSVAEFLMKDLALDALIRHRAVVCGDEDDNLVASYIAELGSRSIQVNWDRIDPHSDWDLLSRVAAPLCDEYAAFISNRRKRILASRICPNQLTFTSLEAMRRDQFLSSPISSFCEWLNPQGGKDSVMHRYCNDGCYDIAVTYDSSPNPNALDWIQRWGECGSPLDLMDVFRTVGTSVDIIEEVDSKRFENFVRSVLKLWKTLPREIIDTLWFIDLIGSYLERGFVKFVGSISTREDIESFCLSEESRLNETPGRYYNLMCENLPLSFEELSAALTWSNRESFCEQYQPQTLHRQQLKYQLCELKCDRLITDEYIHNLTRWIPLWKHCGSPTELLCRISRKSPPIIPTLTGFIGMALTDWTPIPKSECSDDFIASIADVVSSELDWRTRSQDESHGTVIQEFCLAEQERLRSIVSSSMEATVFLAAECDNLPISFDSMKYMSENLGIFPATICNHFAADKRRKSILEFCSLPNCYQLTSINDPLVWTQLWLQCQAPTDPVCGFLHRTSSTYGSVNAVVQFALLQPLTNIGELKLRFGLPPMINAIDKLPQCREGLGSFIGASLGLGLERLIKSGVSYMDFDEEQSFGDVSNVCGHHKDMVSSLINSFPLLSIVCPEIPVNFASLRMIMMNIIPSVLNENSAIYGLTVARETAFSDWVNQVAHRPRFFPIAVKWRNEPGQDVGGITRDWITRVADIVSSPPKCDPLGGLFQLDDKTEQYLVFSRDSTASGEGSLSDGVKILYYEFGRFLAIVLMKREQIGIPLPVFFFSKLIYGMIRPADLVTIDTEKAHVLRKLIEDVQANNFSDEAPFEIEFPELPGVELKLTKANVKDEVAKVLDAEYMPGRANEAMDEIRKGLSEVISIERIRSKLTPALFKYYVVGDESLDIDDLRKLAVRDGERFSAPQISKRVFRMLFDWLKANPQLHRQFMIFTTGSSSLRPRALIITGPDSASQGRVPKAHTCFNWLALPEYVDYHELNKMLGEAIFHTQMGMN